VAYDKHFGIGADNDLLWQRNLPADLKHFKENTTGNAIIMGLNTYNSIGRLLPGRQTIVLSREKQPIDGATVVDSLTAAFDAVEPGREAFIVGGGQVFDSTIDTVDQIFATEVDALFENATIFFPTVNKTIWREISREKHLADDENLYNYDFVTYVRR
jgi:dihydrofolate reductase